MNRGRVFLWTPDPSRPPGGSVATAVVPLPRLEAGAYGKVGLRGRFVVVRNGGAVNARDPWSGEVRALRLGDAAPNADGDFVFDPARGGGRVDKIPFAVRRRRTRYVQAARFGEVNTYFHVDRIAAYIDGLLRQLGARSLPRVVAVVNAHPAATERDGIRDGVRRPSGRWFPFQGGHYRLPARTYTVSEPEPLSPDGEMHLGPGWLMLEHGALPEFAGARYRANASHNAGLIYHEYAHHIARHTADFAANDLRAADQQRNRKAAIEEGTCDYWVATLMGIPHVWAWHRRHDDQCPHRRCLTSPKTMRDYDSRPGADPHANGTIWGAALWDLRTRLYDAEGAVGTDRIVLQTLLLLGRLQTSAGAAELARLRSRFGTGLAALVQADEVLNGGRHHATIRSVFAARGILPASQTRAAPAEEHA